MVARPSDNMYIEIGYVLYLGADDHLPAVKLYTKWMKVADPDANFELQSLFGWASAQLFVQGLRNAGSPPTRSGLELALDKIRNFNASGLIATSDPAENVPGACIILSRCATVRSCECHRLRGPASRACRILSCRRLDSSPRCGPHQPCMIMGIGPQE